MRKINEKQVMKAFGTLLRELRLEAGLTQLELARGAGVERSYISLIECQKRQPSLRILIAFCRPLNVSAVDVVRTLGDRLKCGVH